MKKILLWPVSILNVVLEWALNYPNDYSFGLAYLISTGQNGAHWIGLNDYNEEGGFEWVDGSPVTFVSWADGEPNAKVQFEDCVEMAVDDSAVKWNDHHCNKTIPAICQRHSKCFASFVPYSVH